MKKNIRNSTKNVKGLGIDLNVDDFHNKLSEYVVLCN